MGTQGKVVATAIIWTAFTLIMIFAEIDTNFINLAIVAGASMISTVAVWEGLNNGPSRRQMDYNSEHLEKAKRRENNRLARLVESMSEEDIAALESILSSRRDQFDEDEQIELNRLLAEQDRARR